MYNRTPLTFTCAVLSFYTLLWGTELLFPKSAASAIVLVGIVALGILIVRPGWNVRVRRLGGYSALLFGLLFISAATAAWFLTFFKIPLPYDFSTLKIAAAIPAIIAITGIEELLFRQVMYRWLDQRQVSGRYIVIATALAFGGAHLGPIFIGSPIGPTFYLLQSMFMLWIGALLGEIRNTTGSWPMSWFGHFFYNVAVLFFFL
jgi:hypothetical protein